MINVLFSAGDERWPAYAEALPAAFAAKGLKVNLHRDQSNPAAVDYLVHAPNGTVSDFAPFVNAKAVLNLWAGVEKIVGNPTLTQPLTRMVDAGLQEGMVEWVTGHVLRYHLGMDRQIIDQRPVWEPVVPPLARNRRVVLLGLGELGTACAQALAALNFQVIGWSRRAKDVPGVTCLSGTEGLKAALTQAEICVLLLPQTPATENLLNAETLALMPRGAFLLNPGRGPLIEDAALLAALDSGQIAHATLDVFRVEPLPADDPYWAHPKVTVTPHIASETRAETASEVIAENIRRGEAGEPFLYVVDRSAGY
ncbi:2-hydroxyacid dehydrogenase [Pseudoruegeria sp. SHC-113]|uniref:2-hydroxyacid dehydrogenase n=1 Tax=Pseudoruegeria sp. SHC-113 TaxID=2855439 RepID=UPI0021BAC8D5|nr:glyoxylate/hydroxypyruvate reductase A [Pseudoruegeria sp. SHC-113]MCT8161101.1 glyoxylate/hydroxypyruvate reductase A [Pseudoruegeria sp. SHC-113]